MRFSCRVLVIGLLLSSFSSPALADGPYEPNETAAQATPAPLSITGALETPQDIDWYRFYTRPDRQIGLLSMLNGTCSSSSGTITARVYDADGGYGVPVINLTLGYNFADSGQPKTADQANFTAQTGHRYFIQVRQSLCQGVGYTLQLAPTTDLATTLQDTTECRTAKGAASAARRKLYALRAAANKAHGARRRSLRSRMQLQQQQVQMTRATQTQGCSRQTLDRYPFL